jgi:hypothetical protein
MVDKDGCRTVQDVEKGGFSARASLTRKLRNAVCRSLYLKLHEKKSNLSRSTCNLDGTKVWNEIRIQIYEGKIYQDLESFAS